MSIQGQFRAFTNTILVAPLVSVQKVECGKKDCVSSHYMLSFGWLLWAVDVIVTL